MRVLVLSKRQYTGKDLIDDAFGRFHHLPLAVAALGHEVRGLCASYLPRPEGEFEALGEGGRLVWQGRNVRPFSPSSLYGWIAAARALTREFRPDVIWACSDAFHVILAAHLERRSGVPCVVDLCDNFESYGATHIPGVLPLFRAAVRGAAGVTCVSAALRDYVSARYGARGATLVLGNGVSGEFVPHARPECRRRFGLPADAKVIGTVGAIGSARGSDALFKAFSRLAKEEPRLHLLLAGRADRATTIPRHERIVYLGQLPLAEVPFVIGAMDVAVVCNKRSAFGDYCFPQKLYEIIACGVPPLVADTPGISALLHASPRHRFVPGDAESLHAGVRELLARSEMPAILPVPWAQHGAALGAFLEVAAGL